MISNSSNFKNIDKLNDKQSNEAKEIGLKYNEERFQEKQDDDELSTKEQQIQNDQEVEKQAQIKAAKEKNKEEIENIKTDKLNDDSEYIQNKIENKVDDKAQKIKEKKATKKLVESEVIEKIDNLTESLNQPNLKI